MNRSIARGYLFCVSLSHLPISPGQLDQEKIRQNIGREVRNRGYGGTGGGCVQVGSCAVH